MAEPRHSAVTVAWVTLNLIPLIAIGLAGLALGSWVWGLLLLVLYGFLFVPYGFFIAMPIMVKLFRHPASLHRR
jgi:hypothetical protein